MQNWALQQVLKSLGHTPITIDAYRRYPSWRWLLSTLYWQIRRVGGVAMCPAPTKPIKGRLINKITSSFILDNIQLTKPYSVISRDIVLKEKLSAIVVGSDQVWRPKYNPHLEEMFLRFAENMDITRIAYAASFGTDQWEMDTEQTIECRRLASRFNGISVRESSGVGLCNKYLKVDAKHVLDPTLLLDKESYLGLCEHEKVSGQNYLAFYCLDQSEDKRHFAERIAKMNDLEVREFHLGRNLEMSVTEWLAAFRDAQFVLTDSFHGTVFSILFRKDFLTIYNQNRGGARFISLFDQLCIKNHLVVLGNASFSVKDISMDWPTVEQNLTELRLDSLGFLKELLAK